VRNLRRKKGIENLEARKEKKHIKEDKWLPRQVEKQRVNIECTPRFSVSAPQSEVPFQKHTGRSFMKSV
jgi:hypothetical protein